MGIVADTQNKEIRTGRTSLGILNIENSGLEMNFGEESAVPGGGPPHVMSELEAFRGADIPLDDDAFMAELLNAGGQEKGCLRLGQVFLEEYGREEKAFGGEDADLFWEYKSTSSSGGSSSYSSHGNDAEELSVAESADYREESCGGPELLRRTKLWASSSIDMEEGEGEDGTSRAESLEYGSGAYMDSCRGSGNDYRTDSTLQACGQHDFDHDFDLSLDFQRDPPSHAEQITPTYINMMFNATSMIPLANVGRMLKDEPIERINEEYETGLGDGNEAPYNDFGRCIPVVDLFAMDLTIT